ncbi:hypothetical protein A5672_06375 [Mycobacterium alsense]|uniref:DUF732 domain-containing protein n=1 Tax=Mycobacterium alsense TaxID=324058 RepID=A0A1A2GBK5_9MYCO|nr:DUF732 domain-containing protein [Mycobacterium alsense]MCV7379039.1 DUF732 domain-containing protein [Mycobacterium alsense]OBG26811.1 hypothetical protein A5672_06375 [Mycobacterium alsense]OBJ01798.1 hypothetical protein A5660_23000 [Mycobacterium alsense]OQZ89212.1 hypothetical protein BST11_18900 [Mycobacterium alsense]
MANTRTRRLRPLLSVLAAGFVPAAALLGLLAPAPTAHADGNDDAFIRVLHSHGIAHETPASAIAAGHLVCRQLDLGKTQDQIAMDVMNSSTLDGDHSGFFVAVSERAYCPQYADIPS